MSSKKLTKNVFSRATAIWKPDFLHLFLKEKTAGPTWGFWFTWNTILSLIIGGIFTWMTYQALDEGYNYLKSDAVPSFDFEFKDRKLVQTGLEDPFRIDLSEDAAFIIDLDGKQYDRSSLDVFKVAVIVNESSIYIQDEQGVQEIVFAEFEEFEALQFNKADAISFLEVLKSNIQIGIALGIILGVWFFLAIFRLFTNLWWALLCWIAALILKIPHFGFGKAYLFIMNISFIPFIVGTALLFSGISNFFMGFILYALVCGMNFYDLEQRNPKKS